MAGVCSHSLSTMAASAGAPLSTMNSTYSGLMLQHRLIILNRWACLQANTARSPSKVRGSFVLSRRSRLTFGPSFPLPGNAPIPKGVVEHLVSDFSIMAVAASRAEGVSKEDLDKVVSFPESSSGSAAPIESHLQTNDGPVDVEDSSDLSDYEYAPGSDTPVFRRNRCSHPLNGVPNTNSIGRPNRDFPDRRKRVKLSGEPNPAASHNPPKSADPLPMAKRQPKNRDKRRTVAKYEDRNRKAETLTSTVPTLDASKFNISLTGWQGKNPRGTKNIQEIVDGWKDGTILTPVSKFVRIPHEGSAFLA